MNEAIPALNLHDVTLAFGEDVGIFDVDLSVPRGTIFGLIGPSGSGKTTAIRLMLGLYEAEEGDVQLLGESPITAQRLLRQRIGYMPQQFVLYPELTVNENLNFVASLYGLGLIRRIKRIKAVLELVELNEARGRLGRDLSGGMRRRLLLASALLHDPDVIFADEPTAGLDPILREKLWDHFQELKNRGKTLFITTQLLEEAAHCDNVGLLVDGELVAVDSPERLRRTVASLRTVNVRIQADQTEHFLSLVRQQPEVREAWRDENDDELVLMRTVDPRKTLQDVLRITQQNSTDLIEISNELPSFNEVFTELVTRKRAENA